MDLWSKELFADIEEVSAQYVNELATRFELLFGQSREPCRRQIRSHLKSFFQQIVDDAEEKIANIRQLISKEKAVEKNLGKSLGILTPVDVSEDVIPLFNQLKSLQKSVKDKKAMMRLRNADEIQMLQKEVYYLMEALEAERSDDSEAMLATEIEPSDANVEKLRNLKSLYQTKFDILRIQIEGAKSKIKSLRNCVNATSQDDQNDFCSLPITQSSALELEREIRRCEVEKAEYLRSFIKKVLNEIAIYTRKCRLEENPKPRPIGEISESALQKLEDELFELKQCYEKHQIILTHMDERDTLLEAMKEEDGGDNNTSSDPLAKYKNRGGEMLKRLKQRKINERRLQTIEKALSKAVAAYEKETGTQFCIYGRPIELRSTLKPESLHRSDSKVINSLKLKPLGDATNIPR